MSLVQNLNRALSGNGARGRLVFPHLAWPSEVHIGEIELSARHSRWGAVILGPPHPPILVLGPYQVEELVRKLAVTLFVRISGPRKPLHPRSREAGFLFVVASVDAAQPGQSIPPDHEQLMLTATGTPPLE